MVKAKTYEQVEAMQRKAVRFVADVLLDEDKADEIDSLTVEEYADRKNLRVSNPTPRRNEMPVLTKSELQTTIDHAGELITDMLDPSLTREALVLLVQDLHEYINGSDEEEEDEEDEGEEEE